LEESSPEAAVAARAPLNHRAGLLAILRALPASGFERLCQRLLRESGFQNVTVTGRSGDGGLDGNGVVEVNAFVSFRVLFQCKRYSGAVTPAQVRDFRGAMQGRADKGIILTTGTFTAEARREAVRDGVPPIELVDGEKLLDMFEKLELGLKPRAVFDIDDSFFEDFRK
jgi:restriction system protein